MPLIDFICPDGVKRPVKQCLEQCPRDEGRCLSLPTLHEIGRERIWKGTPSTTQLLNPTRIEYLKIKKDYAIDPFDMAFALLGTRHHQRLDAVAKKIEGLVSEKKLDGDTISQHTGILDLLEPDELKDGFWKLTDYKTWGSVAVAKILGRSNLNGEYDIRQTELQYNDYRTKAERLGFKINRLFTQCTVRDGGTSSAYKNRIPEKLILIPVKKLDDGFVQDYFARKSEALLEALKTNTLPPMCGFEDRWGGRRCKGFCSVAEFCPEGAMVNRITLKE